MPAAVYQGDHRLAVERRPLPDVGADDVLIEVSHCGICGTDLHMVIEGWGHAGAIGGHEYSGVIVAAGEGAGRWAVGDRVVGGPDHGCGECGPCRTGRPHLCIHRHKAGVTPFQGAFAAYKQVAARQLFRIPDELDLRTAALTEPLAVAYHGVLRTHVEPPGRALVTGAGPIGLLTIAVLRHLGVHDVTVSEPGELRRERAVEVGATRAIPPDELVEPALPMDLVDEPYDAAFECSGRPDAMQAALTQLARGGTLVLSGTGMKRPRFDPNRIILNELVVTGSVEYTPDDFDRCIELLASGVLPTKLLIEPADVPLSDLQRAMERLAAGELPGKVLVVPDE